MSIPIITSNTMSHHNPLWSNNHQTRHMHTLWCLILRGKHGVGNLVSSFDDYKLAWFLSICRTLRFHIAIFFVSQMLIVIKLLKIRAKLCIIWSNPQSNSLSPILFLLSLKPIQTSLECFQHSSWDDVTKSPTQIPLLSVVSIEITTLSTRRNVGMLSIQIIFFS